MPANDVAEISARLQCDSIYIYILGLQAETLQNLVLSGPASPNPPKTGDLLGLTFLTEYNPLRSSDKSRQVIHKMWGENGPITIGIWSSLAGLLDSRSVSQ